MAGLLALAACGGGGGSANGGGSGGGGGPGATTYSIGGSVSGLTASGLTLADNGTDDLAVASGASAFTFATKLQSGATYDVTVAQQPTGERCSVNSGTGTGTVTGMVTSVKVTCTVETFTISGTIGGLSASGLELRYYSGGPVLPVAAGAATFAFSQPVPYGTDVKMYVVTQPYWQWCTPGASDFSGPITASITADTLSCKAATASGSSVGVSVTFSSPAGMAMDSSGNLYVADSGNSRIVEISPSGAATTLLGSGAGLSGPTGVAVDTSGNVYVADTGNNEVLEVTPSGSVIKLAGSYNQPGGVAADASGNVYVADTFDNAIREISGSTVTTLAASYSFNKPYGVAVDSSGNVYVADTGNSAIREIVKATGQVKTLSGTFNTPFGLAVDSAGDVYVADTDHYDIQRITPQGKVSTVAGSSSTQGSCDATPVLFKNPFGVAVGASQDLYVADFSANTVCKLAPGP